MIKCFTKNSKGLIEFTPEELEKLLNEIYNSGYSDGSLKNYWWSSPSYTPWWYSNISSSSSAVSLTGLATNTANPDVIVVEARN